MRKTLLFSLLMLAACALNAQYTQNFDAYNHGDYIGVQDASWSTWSGTTGGNEDAKVDTNQAYSGNNSIYFMSTSANGGPQDVVLNFGGAYNTGTFEFSQMMYITANKGSYFNVQADPTIGTTWALNCNFINDGMMYIDDAKTIHVTTQYPTAQWFEFKLVINLNTNNWEVFIDGVSKGAWQNDVNQVASIDYFPMCNSDHNGNNQSEFWVDDVAFTHTPYQLPSENLAITGIRFIRNVLIAGGTNSAKVEVRNLGTTPISSFNLELVYNGSNYQETVNLPSSLASFDFYEYEFVQTIVLDANADSIETTITQVNSTAGDDDSADDSKTLHFTPIVPATGKMVIVEEATGTWCGWCPRGAVALEFLAQDYNGFAQGIAVHNGDPMAVSAYDQGLGTISSGYPSAVVDRGSDIDPSQIFPPVAAALATPPTALMVNGATFNGTGQLEVSVTADFQDIANNDWRIACVLIEDGVTGTASGYKQTNYYAGGSNGDLLMPDGTNWASLPSSVPASQMVYNHVARAISPSFAGFNGLPASINNGDQVVINFVFNLDPAWDTSKVHIVGMLMKPNGKVDNGSSTSITEAMANGFIPGIGVGITEYLPGPEMNLYPNPIQNEFSIELEESYTNVVVEIHSQLGQLVSSKEIQNPGKLLQLKLDAKAGVYFVKVRNDQGAERIFKVVKL